jgi:hypothetical protein
VELEACPGCNALFNPTNGPTHRYIGASPACWDLYTRILAGDPPLSPSGSGMLVVDAYASQHPGDRSTQATQSVAVHLVVLEAVLAHGARQDDATRIRVAAVEHGRKANGYPKLEPEPSEWDLTLQDVVGASGANERREVAARYFETVWSSWRELHGQTITDWYHRVWGSRRQAATAPFLV